MYLLKIIIYTLELLEYWTLHFSGDCQSPKNFSWLLLVESWAHFIRKPGFYKKKTKNSINPFRINIKEISIEEKNFPTHLQKKSRKTTTKINNFQSATLMGRNSFHIHFMTFAKKTENLFCKEYFCDDSLIYSTSLQLY